ncbi:oxidoreductase [Spirochaetia bacterium]|nr:oxidoreductase [Spirochaetia bacterium]
MQYNNLPGTNLKLSALSLGTMMFGSQTGESEALSIMDYAFEQGINFFDTVDGYNKGDSEHIVGKALKGRREAIFLGTQVGSPMEEGSFYCGLSRRHIISAVNASLQRLNTDYIDLYSMHVPDHETKLEESLETLTNLVRQQKVLYIGVSSFSAWLIADILALCDKYGFIAPVISHNVYNLITRGAESELVPFLQKHKLGIAAYNPIAGGLLSGKHKPGIPAPNTRFALQPSYYERYWSDENFVAVDKLSKIAKDENMTLLEMALRWCVKQDAVVTTISGVSKLEQIRQNIAALEGPPLSQSAMDACDAVWKSLAGERYSYFR